MNWILLSPPPLSSDPDNPPKLGTCKIDARHGTTDILDMAFVTPSLKSRDIRFRVGE